MVIKKKVLWNKTLDENHKYYFYNYAYLGEHTRQQQAIQIGTNIWVVHSHEHANRLVPTKARATSFSHTSPVWPDGYLIISIRTMKFSPKVWNICQSRNLQFCQIHSKLLVNKRTKTIPKWRHFAKSGHTEHDFILQTNMVCNSLNKDKLLLFIFPLFSIVPLSLSLS